MQRNNGEYDKFPSTRADGPVWIGWDAIGKELNRRLDGTIPLLVFDTYLGVHDEELLGAMRCLWPGSEIVEVSRLFRPEAEIRSMTEQYVTDNEIFGYLSPLGIGDYFDPDKLRQAREHIRGRVRPTIVYGCGAGYVAPAADLTIYADMARWEIQQRFRKHTVHGLGVDNSNESPAGSTNGGISTTGRCSTIIKRAFTAVWTIGSIRTARSGR